MSNTGLYQNLVKPGNAAPTNGTGGGLDIGTLVQIRNQIWDSVLPSGRLKTALMSSDGSLIGVFKTMISLVSGRKYRDGQYVLGERLIDQIKCGTNVNRGDVPDDVVPLARMIFTMLFGVRITTSEDLDALDYGVDAYYARGNKDDIPMAAVQRAVYLKQNFFPISTYNNTCWDVSIFERYPLVAPIPAMNNDMFDDAANMNKFYTGPGFNGQQFVDGYLAPGSVQSGLTSNIETGGMSQQGLANINLDTVKKYAPIFAILIVVGLIISIKTGLYKPQI